MQKKIYVFVIILCLMSIVAACVPVNSDMPGESTQPITAETLTVDLKQTPQPSATSMMPVIKDEHFPMGINIYYTSYYDWLLPFNELTRQGSGWISFNLNESEWTDGRKVKLDHNGYPVELASDQGVRMILLLDVPQGYMPEGEYTLEWKGSGTIRLETNTLTREFRDNSAPQKVLLIEDEADDEAFLWLSIIETDPTNPVRDIRVWLPGYDRNSPSVFNDHLFELLRPFDYLRLMDWSLINGGVMVAEWEERARMDSYTWLMKAMNHLPAVFLTKCRSIWRTRLRRTCGCVCRIRPQITLWYNWQTSWMSVLKIT